MSSKKEESELIEVEGSISIDEGIQVQDTLRLTQRHRKSEIDKKLVGFTTVAM